MNLTHFQMDSSINSSIDYLQFVTLILCLTIIESVPVLTDNHKLIFNLCPNQGYSNHSNSALLQLLFQQFIVQSQHLKFSKAIVSDDDTMLSGKYQCRNDLSSDECRNCVSKFPNVSKQYCGETIPARIQLSGCYAHYEQDGPEPDTNFGLEQIIHKACSKVNLKTENYEELKHASLSELASGVMSGEGFWEMTYESMYVLAQCRGNLGTCACGECLNYAVDIVEKECRSSISGEIYLENCFISYKYNGDPGIDGYSFDSKDDGNGISYSTLVAVVVSGLSALFLGLDFVIV